MASGPWGEDWEAGERGRGLAIDIAKLNGAYDNTLREDLKSVTTYTFSDGRRLILLASGGGRM